MKYLMNTLLNLKRQLHVAIVVINLTGQYHLKTSFFVKPFLFNDAYAKDLYWESILTDYMYNASFQTLPFSFESLMNLPLYMIEKVYEIQKEIIEKRKQQFSSALNK